MKKMSSLLFILTVTSPVQASGNKAIYGTDSRIEVKDSGSVYSKLSDSVAVRIANSSLRTLNLSTKIDYLPLKKRVGLCSKERFIQQNAAAACTGFLVAPTLLVTAGHCVKDDQACRDNSWVFDYKISNDEKGVTSVPTESVYRCNRIIERKKEGTISDPDSFKDWAIVELDRKVKGRNPLELTDQMPEKNTNLVVIGSPSGIPLKHATGVVREVSKSYLNTNLDTFAGNSGSPVFTASTGKVSGILVNGDVDYEPTFRLCFRPARFMENDGRGEGVMSIQEIIPLLEEYQELN